MGAGGNLRHDAAVGPMLLQLRAHDVGKDAPARRPAIAQHDRRRRFVAAGLDARERGLRTAADLLGRHAMAGVGDPRLRSRRRPGINGAAIRGPRLAPERTLQAAKIRIGTRGSPLALAQAHEVRGRLRRRMGSREDAIEIVVIKTTRRPDPRPAAGGSGGKGLFTKEIEEALLARRDRPRRAFDEGHADRAARRPAHRRGAAARGPARRLHHR